MSTTILLVTQFAWAACLTGTESAEIEVVPLPTSYSITGSRPGGRSLVLGTDGTLRVIDEESGENIAEVPVTEEGAVTSGAVTESGGRDQS